MLAVLLALSLVAEPIEPHADAQARVRAVLNAQGPAFDACTARYIREYPKAKGAATLAFEVGLKGRVERAKAATRLIGARNLRPCLEGVVKTVRFPVTRKGGPGRLSLRVPVEKGARFRLWGPDERRPAPETTQRVSTVIRFLPGDWSLVGAQP